MIWVLRQFITHQILEVGGERVRFPIRVEVEYAHEERKMSGEPVRKKSLQQSLFVKMVP